MLTKEEIEVLMDGTTPGPWMVGPVDDTRVEDADGYEVAQIDGDYNDPDLWPKMEANARLIAAAPDLARTALAALARAEDAKAATALVVERAAGELEPAPNAKDGLWVKRLRKAQSRIRALAPDAGIKALAEHEEKGK